MARGFGLIALPPTLTAALNATLTAATAAKVVIALATISTYIGSGSLK